MTVNIGEGLLDLKFGMQEADVIHLLGAPDKIINEREDGKEYIYNSLKIKLFFDNDENNVLYSIEVFDKQCRFSENVYIGISVENLLDSMEKCGYSKYEIDDFDYFDVIYFEECNTSFTIEFGEVSSFEFSTLFKDANTIIWPKIHI